MSVPPPTTAARLYLILAAVLWSTSSLFIRLLQEETPLGLHDPKLDPLQLAFWRSVFAGTAMLPLLRKTDLRLRPAMGWMVLCFGIMTALYLSAIGLGPAANAILLQNTAPVWVYFVGVYCLGDARDPRTLRAILLAAAGALVIVIGNWPRGLGPEEERAQQLILLMATGSGVFYAAVVLFLRKLNAESPAWLTVLNMFGTGIVVLAFAATGDKPLLAWLAAPSPQQLAFIALFGAVQLAAPYFLFARGLKTVSPQEAGVITLLEPLLNPLWAYLIAPGRETPTVWTFAGGAVLLAALVWRYWPPRRSAREDHSTLAE
jgi:drug/metabolite transporter, DME family